MIEMGEQDPSLMALEKQFCSLENGQYALVFSSGLAACYAVTKLLRAGDHILVSEEIYGGAYHLIEGPLTPYKVKIKYIDTTNIAQVEKALHRRTKMIWLESPSSLLLKIPDFAAINKIAKEKKIVTVVDNSGSSPCSQKPLELGADIVIYSSVKQITGRTDIIAGVVVTNRQDLYEQLQIQREAMGHYIEAIDCFGIRKGMRTLSDRMKQQEKSAKQIANFLSNHPSIETVYSAGFGSAVSFEMKGGVEAASKLLREVKLFALYEKIGDIETNTDSSIRSIIAHARIPEQILLNNRYQGSESVVRLSIGLENTEDLIKDLNKALKVVDHQLIQFPEAPTLRDCI